MVLHRHLGKPSSLEGRALGGGHCRLIEQPDRPQLVSLDLESGDTVALGVTSARNAVLLSLDDVDKTLAGAKGEVGVPTVRLTPAECRWLGGRLLDRAAYLLSQQDPPGR